MSEKRHESELAKIEGRGFLQRLRAVFVADWPVVKACASHGSEVIKAILTHIETRGPGVPIIRSAVEAVSQAQVASRVAPTPIPQHPVGA